MSMYVLGNATPANSSYLELDVASPISAWPLSVSLWVYPTTTTDRGALFRIGATGSTFQTFFARNTTVAADGIRGVKFTNGGNASPLPSNSLIQNTWNHAGFAGKSGTQYGILNGDTANASTQTGTSLAGWGSARHTIGIRHYSTTFDFPADTTNGNRIAEVAVWNEFLTTDELVALSKGVHPLRMRPTALKIYYPLWGNDSPERNLVGTTTSYDITLVNTPTKADHVSMGLFTDSFMNK